MLLTEHTGRSFSGQGRGKQTHISTETQLWWEENVIPVIAVSSLHHATEQVLSCLIEGTHKYLFLITLFHSSGCHHPKKNQPSHNNISRLEAQGPLCNLLSLEDKIRCISDVFKIDIFMTCSVLYLSPLTKQRLSHTPSLEKLHPQNNQRNKLPKSEKLCWLGIFWPNDQLYYIRRCNTSKIF